MVLALSILESHSLWMEMSAAAKWTMNEDRCPIVHVGGSHCYKVSLPEYVR